MIVTEAAVTMSLGLPLTYRFRGNYKKHNRSKQVRQMSMGLHGLRSVRNAYLAASWLLFHN